MGNTNNSMTNSMTTYITSIDGYYHNGVFFPEYLIELLKKFGFNTAQCLNAIIDHRHKMPDTTVLSDTKLSIVSEIALVLEWNDHPVLAAPFLHFDNSELIDIINYALSNGLLRLFSFLLDKKKELINLADPQSGYTLLERAIQINNVEAAIILIDNGAELKNAATPPSEDRPHSIHLLLQHASIDMFRIFLIKYPKIYEHFNVLDLEGRPLLTAVVLNGMRAHFDLLIGYLKELNDAEIVREILDCKSANGYTALHCATGAPFISPEYPMLMDMFTELFDIGADIHICDIIFVGHNILKTPLELLLYQGIAKNGVAIDDSILAFIKFILVHIFSVGKHCIFPSNGAPYVNFPMIILAMQIGDDKIIELFESNGCGVAQHASIFAVALTMYNNGILSLSMINRLLGDCLMEHLFYKIGEVSTISLLGKVQDIPLIGAVISKCEELGPFNINDHPSIFRFIKPLDFERINFLFSLGVDFSKFNIEGHPFILMTAVHLLLHKKLKMDVLNILLDKCSIEHLIYTNGGVSIITLLGTLTSSMELFAKILCKYKTIVPGFNINDCPSLLTHAIQIRDCEKIKFLLDNGFNINDYPLPLTHAIQIGDFEKIKFLLENGFSIDLMPGILLQNIVSFIKLMDTKSIAHIKIGLEVLKLLIEYASNDHFDVNNKEGLNSIGIINAMVEKSSKNPKANVYYTIIKNAMDKRYDELKQNSAAHDINAAERARAAELDLLDLLSEVRPSNNSTKKAKKKKKQDAEQALQEAKKAKEAIQAAEKARQDAEKAKEAEDTKKAIQAAKKARQDAEKAEKAKKAEEDIQAAEKARQDAKETKKAMQAAKKALKKRDKEEAEQRAKEEEQRAKEEEQRDKEEEQRDKEAEQRAKEAEQRAKEEEQHNCAQGDPICEFMGSKLHNGGISYNTMKIIQEFVFNLVNNAIKTNHADNKSAAIFPLGSRVSLSVDGSDIDLVCIVPSGFSIQNFYEMIEILLEGSLERPSEGIYAKDIELIKATIPLIKFNAVLGPDTVIPVDCLLLQTDLSSVSSNAADILELLSREGTRNFLTKNRGNELVANALLDTEDMDCFINTFGAPYVLTVRVLKYFAKAKNIYGAKLGCLTGASLAIMVAYVCQNLYNTKSQDEISPSVIIQEFFMVFSDKNIWGRQISVGKRDTVCFLLQEELCPINQFLITRTGGLPLIKMTCETRNCIISELQRAKDCILRENFADIFAKKVVATTKVIKNPDLILIIEGGQSEVSFEFIEQMECQLIPYGNIRLDVGSTDSGEIAIIFIFLDEKGKKLLSDDECPPYPPMAIFCDNSHLVKYLSHVLGKTITFRCSVKYPATL